MDRSIVVFGPAVLWEEVLEFVGSKVCLNGNARYAIAHRTQQMIGEVEASSEFFMASHVVEAKHCKKFNVAGFSLEFECSDDGQDSKRQNCKLECEGGGERHRREKAAMDGIGPVVETLAQNGSQMDRDMLNERRVCHQRSSAQLGRTRCQNGLLRRSVRRP